MADSVKVEKNIYKRSTGLYRVRVLGFESKSFSKLTDARTHRDKLLVAKQTGRIEEVDADLQKLRELASEHMAAESRDLATNTYDTYKVLWKAHVLTHRIADMTLRMISPKVIEDWRDDLLADGVGTESVRKTMALLQTIMERAVRHGRIAFNPVKAVSKPNGRRKTRIRPLTEPQLSKLQKQLENGDLALVTLLAGSGIRPGEARALTWADIGSNAISIDKAANNDGSVKGTKTEHIRTIKLRPELKKSLTAFRKAAGAPKDDALVFPRDDGSAWTYDDYRNWTKRTFHKAAKDAGLAIRRPYDLRHRFASVSLHEGVSAIQVAAWMGNSPAMTLSTYAHVIEERPAQGKPRANRSVKRSPAGSTTSKAKRPKKTTKALQT